MKKTVDLKDVGAQNEKLVLSLLRRNGAMSQTRLRKLSGLSTSTSSYIIGRLRNKGWINETKGISTTRGAKPVILSINDSGAYAVGVEINPSVVRAGLYDFSATLVERSSAPIASAMPEDVADLIETVVKELLIKNKVAEKNLLGIAIALSGTIENNAVVRLGSPLGWKNVDLKYLMDGRFDTEISIYPTVVRLFSEFKLHKDQENVLYVNAASGVGSVAVVEGRPIGARTGRGGEIGHITIEKNGKLCGCGKRGCLETVIGAGALSAKIKQDIKGGVKTSLTVAKSDKPEDIMTKWGECVKAGDEYSLELGEFVASKLLKPLADTINITQPEEVILAGSVCLASFDAIKKILDEKGEEFIYNYNTLNIEVVKAEAGNDALMAGAAMRLIM